MLSFKFEVLSKRLLAGGKTLKLLTLKTQSIGGKGIIPATPGSAKVASPRQTAGAQAIELRSSSPDVPLDSGYAGTMEARGLEPLTSSLQSWRSTN